MRLSGASFINDAPLIFPGAVLTVIPISSVFFGGVFLRRWSENKKTKVYLLPVWASVLPKTVFSRSVTRAAGSCLIFASSAATSM
ncbi:MAG: hypothetical protein H6Q26_2195 [Bacteroidetes bacterium]|nr:hypothetical protein [Bacteroidota bacterium]